MIKLNINTEEKQILVEILNSTVTDLGMEIADTDQKDYRDVLKKRKSVLMKIVQALQ